MQGLTSYMYVVKAAKTTFVQKIRTFNVDWIDTFCQITAEIFINAGPTKWNKVWNHYSLFFILWVIKMLCNFYYFLNTIYHVLDEKSHVWDRNKALKDSF